MARIMRDRLAGLAPRRKRAGYSQETFAAALDIERARLANYEVGISWPSAALLPAMAELLNCSIDDLYEAPGEPSGPPGASNGPPGASAPTGSIAGAEG